MGMLDDIGAYVDTNTSLTLGTNLFLGLLPESPGNCVALFEESGVSGLYTQGSTNLPQLERPQLQLIVRNDSYATGRSLADTVYRVLTQITNQTINSNLYLRIEATSNPAVMDRDKTKRVLFTCNFDVVRKTP
jgi:hypothetical protein